MVNVWPRTFLLSDVILLLLKPTVRTVCFWPLTFITDILNIWNFSNNWSEITGSRIPFVRLRFGFMLSGGTGFFEFLHIRGDFQFFCPPFAYLLLLSSHSIPSTSLPFISVHVHARVGCRALVVFTSGLSCISSRQGARFVSRHRRCQLAEGGGGWVRE